MKDLLKKHFDSSTRKWRILILYSPIAVVLAGTGMQFLPHAKRIQNRYESSLNFGLGVAAFVLFSLSMIKFTRVLVRMYQAKCQKTTALRQVKWWKSLYQPVTGLCIANFFLSLALRPLSLLDQDFNKAERLVKNGDYQTGLFLMERVAVESDHPPYLNKLAKYIISAPFEKLRNLEKATAYANRALEKSQKVEYQETFKRALEIKERLEKRSRDIATE